MTSAKPLPAPLNTLSANDLHVLESHVEVVRFRAGDCIFRMRSPANGCYVLDEGEVRIEIDGDEIDSDTVLTFLGPGSLLGELGVLDGQPRSASAYAEGDVVARLISAEALATLTRSHPGIALALISALGRDAAQKLRSTTGRLAEALTDERPDPEVDSMVARAAAAQHAFENWTDERVDGLLLALATALAGRAEDLARLTVKETGIGNVHDKTLKNQFASLGVYRSLAGKATHGPLSSDPARKVIELGSPMGVIFGIVPMTNPVATAVFKALISLKARNALILSFHHTCLGVADATGSVIQDVLQSYGAPRDLVQWVRKRSSRRTTTRFMRHAGVALILATGGAGMVKAAYSSGTPALGVGPGNAPALVCADADLDAAARCVIFSKTFDNGLICGAEHHLVVDTRVSSLFLAALERQGAAILTEDEARRFTASVVDHAHHAFRPEIVGQSAQTIAAHTGIVRPYLIRLLVVPTESIDKTNPLAGEKLAPVLSLFRVRNEEHGLAVCRALLAHAGAGHTAVIHSRNQLLIERFSDAIPASRILVNVPASQGCGGMTTGLECSLTLGCGTFGGNSTTDNVTYRHLLNIKRVAYQLESKERELLSAVAGA
jgi:acetaldehyde dehydrogenase/alcohol dehydrogenase